MVAAPVHHDYPSFSGLLPHGLLLDPDAGVLLLSTPRLGRPTLALGCAWSVVPRNVETCDESVCHSLALAHEGLLRTLPMGAALQGIMTILPSITCPPWEVLRSSAHASPIVDAQRAAFRTGMPYGNGPVHGRMREIQTTVTLRLPIPSVHPSIPVLLSALLGLPTRTGSALATRLSDFLDDACLALEGVAAGIEAALRSAGHLVARLNGAALGARIARALSPMETESPVIVPDVPLNEQVLTCTATSHAGGWTFGNSDTTLAADVLSLHHAPSRLYPGILSAPRAPEHAQPMALWDTWDGPMSLIVNVAALDQVTEKARLQRKRSMAFLHRFNPLGDSSPENVVMKKELDFLLETFFATGCQLVSGRVHLVLWGTKADVQQGRSAVIRAGRQLDLEWAPEPVLGSTLFLQTLPLGFDPAWPKDTFLRRSRRLTGEAMAQLLPLYGGFRGTATPSIFYLSQRGEAAAFDPFDHPTNPHMTISGTSGSGKSFTVAHLAQQVLPLGAQMVILDRLPSYQELCAVWGGRYVSMDFNAPLCLNPFYGPMDKSHIALMTAMLAEMASGGVERLNREALGVLSDAIACFAQIWDVTRGEPFMTPFVEEVLRDGCFAPHDVKARTLGKEIARKLAMFYGRGPYAGFVDGPNQLTIDQALTVLELSGLSEAPDLQGTLLLGLMRLLTQFFAAPHRLHLPKYFITDETWALLKHPATAAVMTEIARTYRKLRTSAIFLSQLASDFDSPAGRILRANAATTLFLEQAPGELEALVPLFHLSSSEIALLGNVRKYEGSSTAYLRLSKDDGGLVRLVPDALTRWMVSQDDRDRILRTEALAKADGSLVEALTDLASRYPHGREERVAHA